MRPGLALYIHSFRRIRRFLFAVLALLFAFQILLVLAARSLQDLQTFSGLTALVPDFVRQAFGPSVLTLMSFRGVACLGYVHIAILAFLMGLIISIATETAEESEKRFLDLVLSHPLGRSWIITRTLAMLGSVICLLLAAMAGGLSAGLYWLANPELARETLAIVPLLSINLGLLLFFWGCIALVPASIARRRSTAGATAAILALVSYLTDLISQIWKPLLPAAKYSPFHYYGALNLITGAPLTAADLAVLAAGAGLAIGASYLLFQARDL
jgi:hypothetical protein